jgi:two-component system, NarL family, response regulator DesR
MPAGVLRARPASVFFSMPASVGAAGTRAPVNVAVLDLQMPLLDGLAATAELHRFLPSCAVVILTGRGRPAHLPRALNAGAKGFLPKGSPGGALADVIRRVHAGGRYVDPALAADALSLPESPLTGRERDVLRAADGDTPVNLIARRVSLSPGTVRNHLTSIMAKLAVDDRSAAVQKAREHGWL